MRDSFIFYRSFYEATKILPDKKRLKIYEMIIELGLNNHKIEEKDELIKSLFTLIEPQITANNDRYNNGKKGGAPKGNQNAKKTTQKTTKTTIGYFEKQPNNNVNENENVNVNVNDNESTAPTATNNKTGETIFDVAQEELGRVLSPIEIEIITNWNAVFSEELILCAVRESVMSGARSLRYTERILERYKREGIKTVSEAQKNHFGERNEQKEAKELFDYDWLNESGEEVEN